MFLSYLRRPTPDIPGGLALDEKIHRSIWLFALSILTTFVAGTLFAALAFGFGVWPDRPAVSRPDVDATRLFVAIVLLGPLVEELLFRGWLTGTAKSLVLVVCASSTFYIAGAALDYLVIEGWPKQVIVLALTGGALLALPSSDRGQTASLYRRVFPLLFWGQATAFGVLHVSSYAFMPSPLAIFATLPLVACGLIWAYARIQLGLLWTIALHAAYNVPSVIGMVIFAQVTA